MPSFPRSTLRPLILFLASFAGSLLAANTTPSARSSDSRLASPDGRLEVEVYLNADGAPRYTLQHNGIPVLRESRLGLVREDLDFSRGLNLASISASEPVNERYETLTAKRRLNTYRANRKTFRLETPAGRQVEIVFQLSDDGAAFRYRFPENDAAVHRITDEVSSFHFPEGTHAWLQPMSAAKSGWEKTNPSYEEYYERDIPTGTPSPTGAGWVYPALFRSGETWVLLSESSLARTYCGTRLRSGSPDGEYSVGFPDSRENFQGGPVNPQSRLPWLTPWRVIAVGSLKTIVESTLGLDLADPPAKPAPASLETGKAAWSWPLLGDKQTTYDVQKRFIDYAAEMGWRYCLIDALWDTQIGYEKVKDLVDYARTREVKILLWYNSAGDWNTAPQTPRNRLLTRESRSSEFERLQSMGVAGLKIDFFGGDGQSMIGYYHDILEESAPYGLLINFHGATLPRGWSRTYPHLMTVEAIRGLEFITFEQANADRAPAHIAMLPFTRNVFDPMDFTPVVLDRIRKIERRTSSAFELALSVLFVSGIQHYAEIPEGMAKAPDYVRDFMKGVPSVWDDTKFIAGEPGEFAVIARRSGTRWYVAGVNGGETDRPLSLDLSELGAIRSGVLITEGNGENLSFRRESVDLSSSKTLPLALRRHCGFVLTLE